MVLQPKFSLSCTDLHLTPIFSFDFTTLAALETGISIYCTSSVLEPRT
ncbi:hypothetical protein RSAG8_10213, partial [Rhizoctonia solani AG-8 WAC10335]